MRYDLDTILRFKVPWDSNKIDLYVDVDGVISAPYTREPSTSEEERTGISTHFQLRPDVTGFMRRMMKIYNVKWLTAESEDSVRDLFISPLQAAPDILGVEFADWGDLRKITGVNINRPFWILDDGLDEGSIKWLKEHNMDHRWLRVNGHSIWALADIEGRLRRMEEDIAEPEARRVSFILREVELRKQWKARRDGGQV